MVEMNPHRFFMVVLAVFIGVVSWLACRPVEAWARTQTYDVIIVGAGTSGCAAAIQATRMGAKVALFEETDWIGGQMTAAGISNMDEGGYPPSGLYGELLVLLKQRYTDLTPSKSLGTCYFSSESNCFEPGMARQALEAMIEDARAGGVLDTYLETRVTDVERDGHTVTGILTEDGQSYSAKVVIDATECGEIIPMTGARYRVGNLRKEQVEDPNFDYSQEMAQNAAIQSITYSAVLKAYPDGIPEAFILSTPPPGYDASVQKLFRSRVTAAGNGDDVWSWTYHAGYRGMPNSDPGAPDALADTSAGRSRITKTGINYANDYPWMKNYSTIYADIRDPYPLTIQYLLDREYRQTINCEAKLRTLQFIYYVQNELEVPWALATEEGYDGEYNALRNACPSIPSTRVDLKLAERHLPVMAYVRESIRIVGRHTLTAEEIKRVGYKDERTPPFRAALDFNRRAIAVGDYAIDLHGTSADRFLENYLGESRKDKPEWRYGPFQVPMGCFIPETVDGFLAAEKNISVSRMVSGAVRLQPVTMRTGQAVGVIAALASRHEILPRQVPPFIVQWALIQEGIPLLIVPDAPMAGFLTYDDIPREHPLWPHTQMVGLQGLMDGCGDGSFCADQPVSRIQTIKALHRIGEFGLTALPPEGTLIPEQREKKTSFMAALRDRGSRLLRSSKAYLAGPHKPLSRAHFVELVVDTLELRSNATDIEPVFSDVSAEHPVFRSLQVMQAHRLLEAFISDANAKRTFHADRPVMRGEAAAVFTAALLSSQYR